MYMFKVIRNGPEPGKTIIKSPKNILSLTARKWILRSSYRTNICWNKIDDNTRLSKCFTIQVCSAENLRCIPAVRGNQNSLLPAEPEKSNIVPHKLFGRRGDKFVLIFSSNIDCLPLILTFFATYSCKPMKEDTLGNSRE